MKGNIFMEKIKLYSLPYAGGSTSIFNKLRSLLISSDIELVGIDYAGHGLRADSKALNTINNIVDDIYDCLLTNNLDEKYSLLGYSMGGLVAYELYKKLAENNSPLPSSIIICASQAPKYFETKTLEIGVEIDDNFVFNRLKSYGVIDDELLENEDFIKFFIPIIKADYETIYDYKDICMTSIKSECHILYSNDEKAICDWDKYIQNVGNYHYLEGGHFFIHNNVHELSQKISDIL